MEEIGAFEAKTKLSELLRRVEEGESFRVTRHGRPVAILSPASPSPKMTPEEAVRRIRELRKGNILGPDVTIRELIEEGRE
ncbi:MAG: type II toxin-antitoxin system prevent-host-death family antitoxin [Sphingomonadales bacterium]|nr:type II toxin-antitoxin system prevent-host-death family antitoxin [Sphingomonadales bacterium]